MKIQTASGKKVIQDRWHNVEERDLVIRRICTTLPVVLPEPETITTATHPHAEHGTFPPGAEHYGRSLLDAPLIWFPAPVASHGSGLILVGTHGDKSSSIVTLSCTPRTLTPSLRRHHAVLCVNPDGCQLGLRANANGMDLSRDFPAADWKEGETVYRQNSAAEERDIVSLTDGKPGSEPETQALCQLVHRTQPAQVVSFHDPLAYIENPGHSELGEWLAQALELPLITSVGYEAPGPSGSWRTDLNLHCITAEFPPTPPDETNEKYPFTMANLLRWHPKDAIHPS